jgi:hypothetical protein
MWCDGCKEYIRRDVESGLDDVQGEWFRKRHEKCIMSHWWLRKTGSCMEGESQIHYANHLPYRLDFVEVTVSTMELLGAVNKVAG